MAEDIRNMDSTKGKKSFEVAFEAPQCIVLDSAYCSMGRMIGYRACESAGYAYYDAVTLLELLPDSSVTVDELNAYEQTLRERELTREEMINNPSYQKISTAFEEAITIALSRGKCLIHDRTVKEAVERMGFTCMSVFTYSSNDDYKIERAQTSPWYRNLTDRAELLEKISEEDMIRRNYHHAQSDTAWGEKECYDLMINTDLLGRDYSAVLLAHVMGAE